MAENKTRPNSASVHDFLDSVENETRRTDGYTLIDLIQKITGKKPIMWGNSIIGFGSYHYKYATGREGDMPLAGFSPRKQNMAIYIMAGFERYEKLMHKLGTHKTGKSCLYIKRLSDVDIDVLSALIKASYDHMNTKYNS